MKQGWEVKRLKDLLEVQNGYAFASSLFSASEGMPLIRIRDLKNGVNTKVNFTGEYSKDYIVQKGDFLIGMDGEFRCYEWAGGNALLNQRVCRLQNFEDSLLPKFLFYGVNKHLKDIEDVTSFTTVKHISSKKIKDIEFPIPPLEEQKQIVAKLDQCFEAIDKAKANATKNLENAKELFQSKLNEIFSQKGEGWVEKKLGDVCKYDKNKNQSNNLPYIGLEHIESNSGRFIGSLDSHQVKSSTFHFDSRHVLYGRLRPYLNKVLIPNFEGHCSTEIFPILVGNEIIREYLFYWLISDQTVKKIDATWTGARMPRANMNEVINFILPIPQVEEQKQIVKLLGNLREQTQSLESKYQQELNSLEELKKSILQKAFEGEL